ncbi:hypothetical protein B0O99DRAFT_16673 [Bisporella sp. PMI_857]|nr:hypothetical protein B0O99DRAFT_16673 [Bisporella sp. PMI_857]
MAGTILITGANSSLALPAIQHLLANYPDHGALLTIRKSSDTDVSTKNLLDTIARFPDAKVSIRHLDLSSLAEVHEFADNIASEIADGSLLPLTSIICNASYWNFLGMELTEDGYEKTFQVNHLGHSVLILRLLESFGPWFGRVVLLSSELHWPGKTPLEKYPPALPDDLEQLIYPEPDDPVDNFGHGFQRFANSKLAIVMWMYALNQFTEQNPLMSRITAVALNPGTLSDSRGFQTHTPPWMQYLFKFVIRPLQPLLSFRDPSMRTSAEASVDVMDLAMSKLAPGERGYFKLREKVDSSPDSMDEKKQQLLWSKTEEWAGMDGTSTDPSSIWHLPSYSPLIEAMSPSIYADSPNFEGSPMVENRIKSPNILGSPMTENGMKSPNALGSPMTEIGLKTPKFGVR